LYQTDRDEVMRQEQGAAVLRKALETVLLLLSPFAPHIADELWSRLGGTEPLLQLPWPSWREEALQQDQVTLVVQVNGKVRSRIRVQANASQEDVSALAMTEDKVRKYLGNKPPKRVIYVPGRLINIVV
jgi:leucyl-tRNA synthetase